MNTVCRPVPPSNTKRCPDADDNQGGNDKADERRQRKPAVTYGKQIGNMPLSKAGCRFHSDNKQVGYHRHDKAKQQSNDNADQQPCNGVIAR